MSKHKLTSVDPGECGPTCTCRYCLEEQAKKDKVEPQNKVDIPHGFEPKTGVDFAPAGGSRD